MATKKKAAQTEELAKEEQMNPETAAEAEEKVNAPVKKKTSSEKAAPKAADVDAEKAKITEEPAAPKKKSSSKKTAKPAAEAVAEPVKEETRARSRKAYIYMEAGTHRHRSDTGAGDRGGSDFR